jgi:hypothetical protein
LLVIKDLLNGVELGLMKEISKEVISFKNKHQDIDLTLPGKSVSIVIAGCLLLMGGIISMSFVTQGVILMHADFHRIMRKIDNIKRQIFNRINNHKVTAVITKDPK